MGIRIYALVATLIALTLAAVLVFSWVGDAKRERGTVQTAAPVSKPEISPQPSPAPAPPPAPASPPPLDAQSFSSMSAGLQRVLYDLSQTLPLLEQEEAERQTRRLTASLADLRRTREELAAVHEEMMRPLREAFDALVPLEPPTVLIDNPRNSPRVGVDMVIERRDGKTYVTKSGESRVDVAYVVLDAPVTEGASMALRLHLTRLSRGGGTPVPYLGLIDSGGRRQVLMHPMQNSVQDIRIYRRGDLYTLFIIDGRAGGRVSDQQLRVKATKTVGDVKVYWQMNDTSEVVVEEVRVPPDVAKALEERAGAGAGAGAALP